ncbi:fructosamine kinase family protein [Actinomyces bowdenii]|uniref:fructosamine kinase family protein n=1 Tax=Actinomyces bowdenii TaxID=131109 RepID=UPI0026DAC4C5|nr:fructosamine kinase family protein [Actinomyces bowdenii]MDO5064385.1 fructosamine kinase family protein [Actinomyces bowdenii]
MSSSRQRFRKHDDGPVSTRLEAQGLEWLARAMPEGGAHVVPVTTGPGWLEEPRLTTTRVTPGAAQAFGRALAVTHAAGAPAYGAAPPGWDGRARMGRSNLRLRPHDAEPPEAGTAPRRWGEFYAEDRILPYLGPSRDNGSISAGGAAVIERLCSRLADGVLDADQPELVRRAGRAAGPGPGSGAEPGVGTAAGAGAAAPAVARTHGDLWCGNILWVPADEVRAWAPPRAGLGPQSAGQAAAGGERGGDPVGVLIDPMAHGAHAETDLAALGVFGQRHLDLIYRSYDEVSPLAEGWRERIGLHSLHILMIHAYLFGGGYGAEAVGAARAYA